MHLLPVSFRHLMFLVLLFMFLSYLYASVEKYLSDPIGLAISESEGDAFMYVLRTGSRLSFQIVQTLRMPL